MKIKNKAKNQILMSTVVVLALVLSYMWFNPKVVKVPVEVPVLPVPPRAEMRRRQQRRSPEFRDAPIRQYKPGHMQQMGVLVGDGETLPLYGKEVRGRRDRYHYYTTTGGENLYPL